MLPNWEHEIIIYIISRNTLIRFSLTHPEAQPALERWYALVKRAHWTTMNDVRCAFTTAKVLNGERVRFEIAGGSYRLIAAFDFARHVVFVKFIGTHSEYDRIDALTVTQF